MSETTAEDPSNSTGSVEGRRVHLDLLGGLARRWNDQALPGRRSFGVHIGGEAARPGVEHLLQR